jgi:hypothetical protein
MRRRKAKDDLIAACATAAKALVNGRRAEIVHVLAQGERSSGLAHGTTTCVQRAAP